MRDGVTHYYDGEGRPFMQDCVKRSVESCVREGLRTLVIFTGTGEGPYYAAKELLFQDAYRHLKIVAVTPPYGRPYRQDPANPESPLVRAGINPAMRDELFTLGVPVVAAHLPFKEMWDGKERVSEWTRVAEAFGVLGGGFALCVQAVLVACDAGFVDHGERVVALTADTSLITSACRTEAFLSPTEGVLVEHIICRPMRYSISKATHRQLDKMWGSEVLVAPVPQLSAASAPSPVVEHPDSMPSMPPTKPPVETNDIPIVTKRPRAPTQQAAVKAKTKKTSRSR